MNTARLHIRVTGLAQGIGYRPFVHRLATTRGLNGWVANTGAGAEIELEGDRDQLSSAAQALARDGLQGRRALDLRRLPPRGYTAFDIRPSRHAGAGVTLPLDLAPCDACLGELFDPANRRHRYPFIACAACGPRWSILRDLPWDRAQTTLAAFPLCAQCQAEYGDPGDRRFHAEATGCAACGPTLELRTADGPRQKAEAALREAAARLRAGQIVAIKSIGGYHLAVDALASDAVRRLRERKRRPDKPFAVMVRDLAQAGRIASLDEGSRRLLSSPAAPVVLVDWRQPNDLAAEVAARTPRVGLLLPCSPLHHLLARDVGRPLVMTSANLSGEPLIADDRQAARLLGAIADAVLLHDRPIANPLDDAVAEHASGRNRVLRLGRGCAPTAISTGWPQREPVVAVGGDLKNSAALLHDRQVTLAPYVGDLRSADALARARSQLDTLLRLRNARPRSWGLDAHPDTAARALVSDIGAQEILPVQHHHAHVAACLAEHGLEDEVLGVAWDGMGFGADGTLWGGEFLVATRDSYQRVARLLPFALPGGDAAVHEPARIAVALLDAAGLSPPQGFVAAGKLAIWRRMIQRGVNSPLTSSVGRLFDGVAALLGLVERVSFEGQAALALEAAAGDGDAEPGPLPFALSEDNGLVELDWRPAIVALAGAAGQSVPARCSAFQAMLIEMIAVVAQRTGLPVVLTGGCFQNRRLLDGARQAIARRGLAVYSPERVPPGDGGLALGQLAVLAARQPALAE